MTPLQSQMLMHAEIINSLQKRIHETARERGKSKDAYNAWKAATREMHERYDGLAFPGGFAGLWERLEANDSFTIEAAITFLECRPYFFRSGYIYQKLDKRIGRTKMNPNQQARYDGIHQKYLEHRKEMAQKKRS